MSVFKFTFNPYDYDEETSPYNNVEVSGGSVEDDIDTVFDRFIQFLQGCGYVVDRDKVGYGKL